MNPSHLSHFPLCAVPPLSLWYLKSLGCPVLSPELLTKNTLLWQHNLFQAELLLYRVDNQGSVNPAHGCPWWAVPNSLPAPLTSEQEGDTPVGIHLLCPFTSLISPSIPIMLELRTFYCPLVFIINEKGPEWSFLKFRESIKTRSWNAILLILEMCEICLVTKEKKKKCRGWREEVSKWGMQ